jgi:hypothetical protein
VTSSSKKLKPRHILRGFAKYRAAFANLSKTMEELQRSLEKNTPYCHVNIIPTVKGIISREEYFLKLLKISTTLFARPLMFFTIFSYLFVKNIPIKVPACFYELVTS